VKSGFGFGLFSWKRLAAFSYSPTDFGEAPYWRPWTLRPPFFQSTSSWIPTLRACRRTITRSINCWPISRCSTRCIAHIAVENCPGGTLTRIQACQSDGHASGTDFSRLVLYQFLGFVPAYNWTRIFHFILLGTSMLLLLLRLKIPPWIAVTAFSLWVSNIRGWKARFFTTHFFGLRGIVLNRILWWGAWMVPILRRTRRKVGGNGVPPKTYGDYLRVPSWPISWVMNCLFRWEQEKALKGAIKKGTSLLAVARRER
jgi:hypothetical protein